MAILQKYRANLDLTLPKYRHNAYDDEFTGSQRIKLGTSCQSDRLPSFFQTIHLRALIHVYYNLPISRDE